MVNDGSQMIDRFTALLAQAKEVDTAGIYASSVGIQAETRSMTIALDTAQLPTKPFPVGFPFKGFVVIDATDSNVQVNMKLATQDSFQDSWPIKKGASFKLPYPIRGAFLDWTAQASKTITVLFFLSGEFSTNTLNLINSGGVSITDGDTVTPIAVASVTNVSAQLFAQDTTKKKTQICNYGGSSIFISGTIAVTDDAGGFPGIEIAPGGQYAWENTSACFAVCKAASNAKIGLNKFS